MLLLVVEPEGDQLGEAWLIGIAGAGRPGLVHEGRGTRAMSSMPGRERRPRSGRGCRAPTAS